MSLPELHRPQPLGLGPGPISSEELDVLGRVVKAIGDTEFVPTPLRGRPGAILAAILYGRALGLDGMVALREVSVIEGRPSLSATAVLGRIRVAGHSVELEEGAEQCIAHGTRADTGDQHTAVWTLADAQRAGLAGKQNWRQYPRAMLRSRAVTELARALFSDVFAGLSVYTPEEMGDTAAGGPTPGTSVEEPHPGEAAPEPEPAWPDVTIGTGEAAKSEPERAPEPETEEERQARARGRLFARLGEIQASGVAPPEQAPDWDTWTKGECARMFGVASRADLTADELHALRLRMEDAYHEAAEVPFS